MKLTRAIKITNGLIRGKWLLPRTLPPISNRVVVSTPYASFKKIPYAQPPLGRLRFQDPEPKENWDGVLDAFEDDARSYIHKDSEDCLYLNVYTPKLPNEAGETVGPTMPVLAYINSPALGEDNYRVGEPGPDFLMQHDIVIVTMRSRNGAVGFLTTADYHAPGNFGLKDQLMVLQWIRENIENFCGNPDHVTLAGSGMGAAHVHLHMISLRSRGMFQRAIIQSGSAIAPWATKSLNDVRTSSFELGRQLGIETTNSESLLLKLRSVDYDTLEKTANKLTTLGIMPSFTPVVEAVQSHPSPMLKEKAAYAIQEGHFSKVPLIIGCNNKEGLIMAPMIARNPELIPLVYDLMLNEAVIKVLNARTVDLEQIKMDINKFYFHDREPTLTSFAELINFFSDAFFAFAILKSAILQRSLQDVYVYEFAYSGEYNFRAKEINDMLVNSLSLSIQGASNGDELPYLFNSLPGEEEYPSTAATSRERSTTQRMAAMWSAFIKTGNPTHAEDNSILKLRELWTPTTKKCTSMSYLDISNELTMKRNCLPQMVRMEFWLRLQDKYSREGRVLPGSYTTAFKKTGEEERVKKFGHQTGFRH